MEFLSVDTVPIALIWARHSASAGAASPRIRRVRARPRPVPPVTSYRGTGCDHELGILSS